MIGSSGRSASWSRRSGQVPLELPLRGPRRRVADVRDHDVGPPQLVPRPSDRQQDLLVHAVFPTQGRVAAEQPDVVHRHPRPVRVVGVRELLHQVGRAVALQAVEHGPQPPAVLRVEPLVGVEPEDPVAGRVADALVPRGGEVVHPREIDDDGAAVERHLAGPVGRAGVDDDHLVHQVGDRGQAVAEHGLGVPGDHAERDAGAVGFFAPSLLAAELAEPLPARRELRVLRDRRAPLGLGLGGPPGLLVDHRELVPRLVAAQPLVDVREALGPRPTQQFQERRLGPGVVPQLAEEHRLVEEQLVVGEAAPGPPGRRRGPRGDGPAVAGRPRSGRAAWARSRPRAVIAPGSAARAAAHRPAVRSRGTGRRG